MAEPQYEGGILRVASAAQTAEALNLADAEKAKRRYDETKPEVISLVGYLLGIWEQNRRHKEDVSGVQNQMLANLQARNNEYSDTKKAEILAAGMPDIYMGLTNVKCAHAESWLKDIFSSSERTWGIQPTPVPDPPDELRNTAIQIAFQELQAHFAQGGQPLDEQQFFDMMQKLEPIAKEVLDLDVKERMQKMETKIFDQFIEGGWDDAFDDFISDLVTMKAGIVKGPIARNHRRLEYATNPETGKVERSVTESARPEYWRVSPLDIYPSPTAENVNDGSLVEKIKLSRADLIALKGEAGYDAKAIDKILENFPSAPSREVSTFDSTRDKVEDKEEHQIQFKEDIDGLEFWCSVQGKSLIEHGVGKLPGFDKLKIEPLEEYPINAITVNDTLIYVALNDDPLGRRPYSKTGWRKVPGSFWYKGVPELMEDLQRIINAAVRALCYNMSLASGPQVEVDVDRLVAGENLESCYPGKIWQVTNRGNNASRAVQFFSPDSNAVELFGIYENFAKLADDFTGIPAYSYGSDRVAGAGRTSSGLSMLMTSAAKGIKSVILSIDKNIFKTMVRRQFDWNMQYEPDDSIKGDVEVVTTGAVAIMVKEQMSERRMQFLQATQNDIDLDILGLEGRANILREAASALEMDGTKTVKDPEEIREFVKQREEQQAQQAAAEQQTLEQEKQIALQKATLDLESMQLENELKKMELMVEQSRIQLEAAKLELEQQKLQLAGAKSAADIEINKIKADAAAQKSMIEGTKLGLDAMTSAIRAENESPMGTGMGAAEDEVAAEGVAPVEFEEEASG